MAGRSSCARRRARRPRRADSGELGVHGRGEHDPARDAPADPYSVNIWVALGEHLYVHAGANRSAWVENLEADPHARLRADGKIYELSAARVADQAEFDRFSDAYEKKYGRRPRNESVAEAYLFRLTAR